MDEAELLGQAISERRFDLNLSGPDPDQVRADRRHQALALEAGPDAHLEGRIARFERARYHGQTVSAAHGAGPGGAAWCAAAHSTFGGVVDPSRRRYCRAMGILADLTARAEAELQLLHTRLADLPSADPDRPLLEDRRSELEFLLHDLSNQLTSPLVLSSVAALRSEMHSVRRETQALSSYGRSIANAS
jgi:hypothetical protein